MSQVGLEPTIPAFEGAKTVHALDRAATVIDNIQSYGQEISRILRNMKFHHSFDSIPFQIFILNNKQINCS
jgi:hypothetical protein